MCYILFIENLFTGKIADESPFLNFKEKKSLFKYDYQKLAVIEIAGHAGYVSYFFSSSDNHFGEICQGSESISVTATFYNIQLFIIGLILKIVFIMCAIIVIARVFELLVYTAIAPIPLATLSCEGLQDVGKGFLKSFAGVCLQSVVIIIMMIVYSTMLSSSAFDFSAISNQWRGQVKLLLFTFIFGAGVMQSGSWAKKICGAM